MKNTFLQSKKFLIFNFIIVSLLIIMPLYRSTAPSDSYKYCTIDDNWTAEYNGEVYENITLSQHLFPMFNKGDVLVLTRKLNVRDLIQNPVLQCYSFHSAIEVYINDMKIYSYGIDLFNENKLVGYGYNFIPLPNYYTISTLKVVFTVSENRSFNSVPAMKIVNGNTITNHNLRSGRIYLIITLFLIMLGLIGMPLSFLIIFINTNLSAKIFCITALSLTIGVWSFCVNDIIYFFIDSLELKVYLEYTSFYAMMIPFTGYFADVINKRRSLPWLRILYWIIFASHCLFFTFAVICNFTNLIHFPAFLIVEHILMFITILYMIIYSVTLIYNKENFNKTVLYGFAIAIAFATVELVRFNISKYFTGFSNNKYNTTINIYTLIIIVTLILDSCKKFSSNIEERFQKKLLEKMAYRDELTGLANRRKCDEKMFELKSSNNSYAIISLDMNLLKHMNDTLGHAAGDKALTLFGNTLKNVFPKDTLIARTGGDEFIVIISKTSKHHIDKYMKNLENMMKQTNSEQDDITLSAAWGIAYSTEESSPEAVLKLADERMYEHKRISKMGRT